MSSLYNTKIVVLAGGKGTRLKAGPKPVVEVAGKPMLQRILESIYHYNPDEEVIVLTSLRNRRAIEKKVKSPVKIIYCRQMKSIGTADAIRTVLRKVEFPESDVLVMLADRPLIRSETIRKLIKTHVNTKSTVTTLTTRVPNYKGVYRHFYYDGRIFREKSGIVANLETSELTDQQLNEMLEVYPSTYVYNKKWLQDNMEKIQLNPVKNEYFLTQFLNMAARQGMKINSVQVGPWETIGVNTQEQRLQAEEFAINKKRNAG